MRSPFKLVLALAATAGLSACVVAPYDDGYYGPSYYGTGNPSYYGAGSYVGEGYPVYERGPSSSFVFNYREVDRNHYGGGRPHYDRDDRDWHQHDHDGRDHGGWHRGHDGDHDHDHDHHGPG